jgi:hypothetical protein
MATLKPDAFTLTQLVRAIDDLARRGGAIERELVIIKKQLTDLHREASAVLQTLTKED